MNEFRAFLSHSKTLCPQLKKVGDNTYCVINSLPLSSRLTCNCLLWKMDLGLLNNFSWLSIIKNARQILQEERFAFCFSGASGVFPAAHVASALPASMVPALGSCNAWQPVASSSFPWHPLRQFHKDVSPARHPSMNTFS